MSILVFATFLIRALVFHYYIVPNEYYRRADSIDYHGCTLSLLFQHNMMEFNKPKPIFWRTPGYSMFLFPFYYAHKESIKTGSFSESHHAQQLAIWAQIILCSFIPVILFFLALLLIGTYTLSWILAWISCFHVGLILSSTYLMTDALALILFYLFLIKFYQSFSLIGESIKRKPALKTLAFAAALLSMYTWVRPMGEKIGILVLILLLFSHGSWISRFKKIVLFGTIFFTSLSPWYLRNYIHTGRIFFWPSSAHLNVFAAPKLLRRIKNVNLEEACTIQNEKTHQVTLSRYKKAFLNNTKLPCGYLIHAEVAWPLIRAYPGYALYDFFIQILNTTFDLYSCQFVDFVNNTYTYEPLEQYISDTIPACLYTNKLSPTLRIIAWLEFIFSILLWLGLLIGFWRFIILPCYKVLRLKKQLPPITFFWLKLIPFIGSILIMGGFFGYARLRLPIEPLMILLSLTFWYARITNKKILPINKEKNEKNIRTVAQHVHKKRGS